MCDSCCWNVILIWSCLPRQFHAFFNRLQIRFLPSVLFGRSLLLCVTTLSAMSVRASARWLCFSSSWCYCFDARRPDRLKAVVSMFDFDGFRLQKALLFREQRAAAIMQTEECHEDHHMHHVV